MPTIKISRSSFNGGEWTPELWQRTDNNLFYSSCKTCLNFIPHTRGGASNRAGFEFIHEVKDSTKVARLFPFQFSVVQSYILEFGDFYFRVYKDGGIVVDPVSLLPVEFVTPYSAADLALLDYEQSADTMFFTHPSYPPQKITRTSHTAWTVAAIAFGPSQPGPTALTGGTGTTFSYTVTAINANEIESIPSNVISSDRSHTISWTAAAGAAKYRIYEANNGSTGWYSIDTTTATSYAIPASVTKDTSLSPPQAISQFGSTDNYPGTVGFHDQRLNFARTNNNPQTLFGSVVGDFYNMDYSSPVQDNDAYEFTLASTQVNEVRWIVSLANCIIGTAGGEWLLRPGGSNTTITPTSVSLQVQSRWGVAKVKPIVVGNSVLFILGSGREIRNLVYSLNIDGYDGNDLSILAAHLFVDYGITEWAFQQYPDSIAWAIREDGVLLGFTYVQEHKVQGWSRHVTQGTFESVASVSVADGVQEVWVIVNRTLGDGSMHRYVERLNDRKFDVVQDCFFVDSGLSYDSDTPLSEFAGLDHLEGLPVACLADGDVVEGLTVVGGKVTLPSPANVVHIGLPYTGDLEPLDFNQPTQTGELLQKTRNVAEVRIAFQNTREAFVGPALATTPGVAADAYLDEVAFRDSGVPFGTPTPLFSGIKKAITVPAGDVEDSSSIFIRVKRPLPCTVQYAVGTVAYGDD